MPRSLRHPERQAPAAHTHPPTAPPPNPSGYRQQLATVRIDVWQLFWVIVFANLATGIIAGSVAALVVAGS